MGDYLLFGQDRKVGRHAGGGINPMTGDAVPVEGGVKPGVGDEAAEFKELGVAVKQELDQQLVEKAQLELSAEA